jgi:pyruvate dehydrogenase E1 component
MQQTLRAQEILAEQFDVAADVWSVTSYGRLRNEALEVERWNRLHASKKARVPYVTRMLAKAEGPVIASSDFMKSLPDMIARWVGHPFVPLGTDGFGRSDTRESLRRHFEIDAEHIVVATLHALAQEGKVKPAAVDQAIRKFEIDPDLVEPRIA